MHQIEPENTHRPGRMMNQPDRIKAAIVNSTIATSTAGSSALAGFGAVETTPVRSLGLGLAPPRLECQRLPVLWAIFETAFCPSS
ncbi:MAG: hypothetical protein MJE77_04995 [Proteobacteria bacterium]|nr:hypothetical protein [Pseudomonadota bacterium]